MHTRGTTVINYVLSRALVNVAIVVANLLRMYYLSPGPVSLSLDFRSFSCVGIPAPVLGMQLDSYPLLESMIGKSY